MRDWTAKASRYGDLVVLGVIAAVFIVIGVALWPDTIRPSVCVDELGKITDCAYVDDEGKQQQRDPQLCKTNILGSTSCNYARAIAFLSSFGVPLGVAFTWLVTFFVGEKVRLSELVFRRDDIKSYLPVKDRKLNKNTVLLLGLGRSGKTEIINRISSRNERSLPGRTEKWSHYGFGIENYQIDTDKRSVSMKTLIIVNDYRGQSQHYPTMNIADQIKNGGWYRPDLINSIVLVVDVFNWVKEGDENNIFDSLDIERIAFHNSQWVEAALDLVFGLTDRDALKGVYLFINKIDQYKSDGSYREVEIEARQAFKGLIDYLRKRAERSDVVFETFVGSARLGTRVVGEDSLVEALVRNSEKIV